MIKASFEILYPTHDQSFLVRKLDESAFKAPYHFHPEFELTAILKGNGRRYIGNHMGDFKMGDLVFVGENLPHCWKLETGTSGKSEEANAIVIQFTEGFLGNGFFDKAELASIKRMLNDSRHGILFEESIAHLMQEQLISLCKQKSNFDALLHLMSILHTLASSEAYSLLEKQHITAAPNAIEQLRINNVMAYIIDNFKHKITLDEAAGIAHMTPNAFCKFFKKATRRTFIELVIEYRLNYALQQLIKTDKPISEISFESGFGDVSHFFKLFKAKTHFSPSNYRKKFILGLG